MMDWTWCDYTSLSRADLYDAMRLRQEVFIVEQNCPYLDADGLDDRAIHLLGHRGGTLMAYARVLLPGVRYDEHCISRVVTAKNARGMGIGRQLMHECLTRMEQTFGPVTIRISAQRYLLEFYRSFGFEDTGKEYLEDGIPHCEMFRNAKS